MSPDPLLTPAEAGAELGLSPNTLSKWRVQGRGPAFVKLGDGGGASGRGVAVRYRLSVVRAWVESHARRSTSDKPAA
jgi:hypothetical protein